MENIRFGQPVRIYFGKPPKCSKALSPAKLRTASLEPLQQ
jgi:hypothetical protein